MSKKLYTYKEKHYKILDRLPVKDIHTREWVITIRYEQVETGLIFGRELEEFFKLFKLVE